MLLGSASKLQRTVACPASGVLPQTAPVSEKAVKAGEWGTAVHTVLEYAPEEGLVKASERVAPEYRQWTEQIPLRQAAGYYVPFDHREVSFAWRGAEQRWEVLGRGLGRDYGKCGDLDVTGTMDVLALGHLTLEVADYKTGQPRYLPEPDRGQQLLFGAKAAVETLAPRAERIVLNYQSVRVDRRRKKNAVRIENKYAVVSRWDLDVHHSKLVAAQQAAVEAKAAVDAGEDPEVVEGDHCFFCPARLVCPAKR